MSKIERRFLHELRAESQGDEAVLVGYAAKFGTQSEDLGGFRETVMPGAFTRSIREGADVKFLMNHDPSLVMGRTKNKTLQLEEDGVGLKFRVVLPPTQAARDLYALVKRGDMDQCSFAFVAKNQSWKDSRDGNGDLYTSRKLMDVDLLDTSAVTYPAYANTEVSARQLFPEGEPVEVRSALDKVAAERKAAVEVATAATLAEEQRKLAEEAQKVKDEEARSGSDADKKAKKAAKEVSDAAEAQAKRDHVDDVSDPDSPDYDPDDPDYDPEWEARKTDAEKAKKDAAKAKKDGSSEDPDDGGAVDGKKSRKIGGRSLTAEMFAFVGDVNDPSTFKLPIDTSLHIANSIKRFSKVTIIPADQRGTVWSSLVQAAKKDGTVKISEEDSLRAGIAHDVALSILNELSAEEVVIRTAVMEGLRARVRMIEIDLD